MKKLTKLLEEFQSTVLGTQSENGFGEAYNIGGEKMNELVERTGKRGHN